MVSLVIFWWPEARRGTLLTAEFLKSSGSEIGSPTHAAKTNTSEWIQSCYSTDPEQKYMYKKVLLVWTLGNLCLTWHQIYTVRFLTWQHQLWSYIEKIYAALKVRIWQLTGTSLSTVPPCFDIAEKYVHTMWTNTSPVGGKRAFRRCHHWCCFYKISSFGADVFIAGKVQALSNCRRIRCSKQKCEVAPYRRIQAFHPRFNLLQFLHVF